MHTEKHGVGRLCKTALQIISIQWQRSTLTDHSYVNSFHQSLSSEISLIDSLSLLGQKLKTFDQYVLLSDEQK